MCYARVTRRNDEIKESLKRLPSGIILVESSKHHLRIKCYEYCKSMFFLDSFVFVIEVIPRNKGLSYVTRKRESLERPNGILIVLCINAYEALVYCSWERKQFLFLEMFYICYV